MDELYKVHRPTQFKQVIGQPEAVAALMDMGKRGAVPHTILFSGESGCGKTTLARIVREKLGCHDRDFAELNCADFRGIDMVRDIRRTMCLTPLAGPVRVYLIDEAHQLTAPAQDALLKILEDTPKHVYFFLCTTDPQKLKKTIRTRCTDIRVSPLTPGQLQDLVTRTVADEGREPLASEVVDAITAASEGSARKAMVILHQVIGLATPEEQVAAVSRVDTQREGIAIARALLDTRTKWQDMAGVLRAVEEDVESIRWMVLSYATKVLLGRANARAAAVLAAFRDHWYDSKKAGLVLACWEVVEGGK